MGANAVNTVCERLAPQVEAITGGKVHLRILSNLPTGGSLELVVRYPLMSWLSMITRGRKYVDGIIAAYVFAAVDPYRAATHNKGIMNGVDAVVIATGNDWRAIEAGAHAYAARSGKYTSLSTWGSDAQGSLVGTLEMPMRLVSSAERRRSTPQRRLQLIDRRQDRC